MFHRYAIAAKATLVTRDEAFGQMPDGMLAVEDWVKPKAGMA